MIKDATDKKQKPKNGTRKGKKMVDEAIQKFNDRRGASKDSDKR